MTYTTKLIILHFKKAVTELKHEICYLFVTAIGCNL